MADKRMTDPTRPAADPRKAAILEALAELRAEYAEGLMALVSDLEAAAEVACSHRKPSDIRHATMLAHRMHGAAGSYGFKGVSAAAATMEELLSERALHGAAFDDAFAEAARTAASRVRVAAEGELRDMRARGEDQKE